MLVSSLTRLAYSPTFLETTMAQLSSTVTDEARSFLPLTVLPQAVIITVIIMMLLLS